MISGKENYTRSIQFQKPEYIPAILNTDLSWLSEDNADKKNYIRSLQQQIKDDIIVDIHVAQNQTEPVTTNNMKTWVDEWGTGWEDDGFGAKAEQFPLVEGYHVLDSYPFPSATNNDRFDEVDPILEKRGDRYVRASVWFTLFERMWMLRGFENMLIDPYLYEREFCYLRDKITDYTLEIIDRWLERKVDGIFFSDDWGSQKGLLINPEDWRKYYKPTYKKLFDRVLSSGTHVWMHLCGNIQSILPDLIDIGLNVLNPVQPQAMNVETLAKEFGGKVCFYGGVDVQGTLITGTPRDVKDEVKKLIELFGSFNGGYIGGPSHSVMPETPLDNVIAMYECFLEYQK